MIQDMIQPVQWDSLVAGFLEFSGARSYNPRRSTGETDNNKVDRNDNVKILIERDRERGMGWWWRR